jgi:NhaA family Na+:H+ antiporter
MGLPHSSANLPRILKRFIATESSGGLVMLLAAALALIAANSGAHQAYHAFISAPITFSFGSMAASESLAHWVKDIGMVFFFLLVGLELKREFTEGFLAKRAQIFLPLIAAAAGMLLPALIFLAITAGTPEYASGWAIPAATDIAFALCVLTLCGKHLPPSIKIFLLAIAIFDDVGAILIIALFYSNTLMLLPLLLAVLGIAALYALQRAQITQLWPYMVVGVFLWFCLYHGGVHTTVAGVVVGLMIPMRDSKKSHDSPVNRAIHFLHPWVSFLVLPLFAFTAAGVSFHDIRLADMLHPVPLGIALALFFGKQIGIFGASFLAIKLRLATLPNDARWAHLYGVSIIAGVGFTMSLFIGALAYDSNALQNEVKLGVIAGSLLSSVWGAIVLRLARR